MASLRGAALLMLILFAAVALPAAATRSAAHELWLSPSSYTAAPGRAVEVRTNVGDGFRGPWQPYPADRTVRFEIRWGPTHSLDSLARGDSPLWARFVPSDSGGAMLAWESGFLRNELPAERFEAYLEEDGLDSALAARQTAGDRGPGIERYRRCAKTWLDGDDADRATTAFGLPLEIVPLGIPGRVSSLTVRVLFEGRPIAGILVRAWLAPLGTSGEPTDPAGRYPVAEVWHARSDAEGIVTVPCAEIGEWLIGAVHMVRGRDRAAADWESTWTSLTFARLAGTGGREGM